MSGCSYSCLVYPESGYVRYVPSAIQLEAAVRALVAGRWLESPARGWRGVTVEESGSFRKVPLEITSLTSGVEALAVASTFWIEMHNQRDSGDPTPFEEDPEGVFRPEYCEDAYLFVSGLPLAVEDPYGTAESACPACGGNVLVSRTDHPDVRIRKAMLMPQLYAPERCPKCGKDLDLRQLSMSLTTVIDSQSPRAEVAPFFRFGIWLLPVEKRYPETERVVLDPTLLLHLQEACGVPFRSVGTLSCS